MPCFRDLADDRFTPISAHERAFIEALVALAPGELAPVLTQLGQARACDDGTGWLVVRGAHGAPCAWPMGYPFDVVNCGARGPHGCYNILLWFDDEGQLSAVELLMLENEPLDLRALTLWLASGADFTIADRSLPSSRPA